MLSKKYRLPIQKIYKIRGRFLGNKYFSVKIIKNNLDFNRFGAVVGTKVSKKAIIRNKLRRLMFNIICDNYKNFEKIGFDVLIMIKPPIINLSKNEIKELLVKILLEIRTIRN